MRTNGEPRSCPRTRIVFATALALAGVVGPTCAAADAPTGRTALGRNECAVCIVGTPVVTWSGTSGSLHVDGVENKAHSSSWSGSLGLQVQLRAIDPEPRRDARFAFHELSDVVPLGPLPVGSSRSDIDLGRIAFDGSRVAAGEYVMLVTIVDDVPGSPHVEDDVVLPERVSCDGSLCAISRSCSAARIAGTWGYTKTGTVFAPSGPAPFATVGILSLSLDGSLTGVNTGGVGGKVSEDVLEGTYQMNPDCTGTMAVEVYDPAGTLLRTLGMSIVLDEDESHVRGILTSLVLPNGMSLPGVITADARRVTSRKGSPK